MSILWKWKILADFADGSRLTVCGDSEEECMEKIGNAEGKHGKIENITGVTDDDYECGERKI